MPNRNEKRKYKLSGLSFLNLGTSPTRELAKTSAIHEEPAKTAATQEEPAEPDLRLVVYDHVPCTQRQDALALAESKIQESLEAATLESSDKGLVYGNQAGKDLLSRKDSLSEKLNRMEQKLSDIADFQKSLKVATVQSSDKVLIYGNQVSKDLLSRKDSLSQKLNRIEQKLSDVACSEKSYFDLRQRFIEVHNRDGLRSRPTEPEWIHAGNSAAHDGDVMTDASLYQRGLRTDAHIFKDIYGLDWEKVVDLESRNDNSVIIKVVNIRGTLRVNVNPISDKWRFKHTELAFARFLKVVESNPGGRQSDNSLRAAVRKFREVRIGSDQEGNGGRTLHFEAALSILAVCQNTQIL